MGLLDFVREHKSGLLTVGVVIGTIVTEVLSIRAGIKLKEEIDDLPEKPTKKQMAKVIAAEMFNPTCSAIITGSLAVIAHYSNANDILKLTSAGIVTERALNRITHEYDIYREKAEQQLTREKVDELNRSVKEEMKKPGNSTMIFSGNGGHVFTIVDDFTGIRFKMDLLSLKGALNEFNGKFVSEGYLTVAEWYNILNDYPTGNGIGLPIPKIPEVAYNNGWSATMCSKLLQIDTSDIQLVECEPVIHMKYNMDPVSDYKERY